MIRHLRYLCFFLILPITLWAQRSATVSGNILNQEGKPLEGITVVLQGTSFTAQTDNAGKYSLRAMPGKYKLVVGGVGLEKITREVIIKEGDHQHYDFKLKASNLALEEVNIKGKTAIQEVRETPFNVVALDAKSQYNSTLDLAGLLAKASGVKVRETGGVGSDMTIAINGFTGRHVKIFMDGVPMQGSAASFQLNNIPVSLAERIEVYKGVVPVEFGADAIGGVINIVTNQTTNSFVDASYSYGSFNTHRSNLVLGHTTKKGLSFSLNAYQNYSDNDYKIKSQLLRGSSYTVDSMTFKRFHAAYHNEAIVAKLGVVNKSWADRFFIGATLSQDYKELQNSPTNIRFVYGEATTNRKGVQPSLEYYKRNLFTKGLTLRVSGNYSFNNNHNVDTSSYRYDWNGVKTLNVIKGERSVMALDDFKNSNYAITGNVSYQFNDKQSLTLNDVQSGSVRKVETEVSEEDLSVFERLRRLSLKNVLGVSYRYRHSRNWNVNVFGKNYYQKAIGPVNLGDEAHADWQERTASKNATGYGIATTYFYKDYQFKASAEKALRLPTDNELFGDEAEEAGNAELKPESSLNMNLGVTLNRAFKNKDVLYVDVNGYYRYTKDYIFRELLLRTGGLTPVNLGSVQNIGVDVEARYYFKNRAMLGATVTYQDIRDKQRFERTDATKPNLSYDQILKNTPYFFGSADAAYYFHELGGKNNVLNLAYSLNFVGEFYLYWANQGSAGRKLTLDQQLSHDISATYMLKNGRYNITLEGKNLTDAELADNFAMLKPGRAFYLKLRYYFINRK